MINGPKIIYFSDPFNNPRSESWAGLLFAATALLVYLKIKIDSKEFLLVFRFAMYGLTGGALGFGLGAFWLVLGFQPDTKFLNIAWWKLMEFSFGFILGGFLGYAAWRSRNDIKKEYGNKIVTIKNIPIAGELIFGVLVGFLLYFVIP